MFARNKRNISKVCYTKIYHFLILFVNHLTFCKTISAVTKVVKVEKCASTKGFFLFTDS